MWVAEATELLGQGHFGPSSSARKQSWVPELWAPSLPEESLPAESALTTGTQERVGLPGMLIEANRITWGTSSSQRQLEHLTQEITRWQKSNIRILITENKTTQHHQNPVLQCFLNILYPVVFLRAASIAGSKTITFKCKWASKMQLAL
jgi:hypothetical protein